MQPDIKRLEAMKMVGMIYYGDNQKQEITDLGEVHAQDREHPAQGRSHEHLWCLFQR